MNCHFLPYLHGFSVAGTLLLGSSFATAQIVPDDTLPQPSRVDLQGDRLTIDGGTRQGTNLFHSFDKFSVPTGMQASFDNPGAIENIITRVTGAEISEIDGLIRANGSANLFFLNPNGIEFGPNARLQLGGSFFASTADAIALSDGSLYSATEPQAPSLLTVSVPVGLQFDRVGSAPENPPPGAIAEPVQRRIVVRGSGHRVSTADSLLSPLFKTGIENALQVNPGRTLALIGSPVALEGGVLIAEGGQIELGGVSEGRVTWQNTPQGWNFDYTDASEFADLSLSRQSLLDTSGAIAGEIALVGRRLTLTEGSLAWVQNRGSQASGGIRARARESLIVNGASSDATVSSGFFSETIDRGSGGDLEISAQSIALSGGGRLFSRSFGDGPGGHLSLRVTDSIQLTQVGTISPNLFTSIYAYTLGSGRAGDLSLVTRHLSLIDGTAISSGTQGPGNGGNLVIEAAESISVSGVLPILLVPSSINTVTTGSGNAGAAIVETGTLSIRQGGRIGSTALGSGAAGRVQIEATEEITISDRVPGALGRSTIVSSANIVDLVLQEAFGFPARPSGGSGNITIAAPLVRVLDGAEIAVENEGVGDGGSLFVRADSVILDRGGRLNAATTSGTGGNITLQVRNQLSARGGSQINAQGGETGNGGNIRLDVNTIVALENSDLVANAVRGQGGNIEIRTQGIFGPQFRDRLTPDSDITASSQFGVNGIVNIKSPEIDASSALSQLSVELADPSTQIVTGCSTDERSSFALVGRGGLPTGPSTRLRSQRLWEDLRDLSPFRSANGDGESRRVSRGESHGISPEERPVSNSQSSVPVEAEGWRTTAAGEIELVGPSAVPEQWAANRPEDCNLLGSVREW